MVGPAIQFSSHLSESSRNFDPLLSHTFHCCCFQFLDIRIQWKVKLADKKDCIVLTTKNSKFEIRRPGESCASDISHSSNFSQQVSTNLLSSKNRPRFFD